MRKDHLGRKCLDFDASGHLVRATTFFSLLDFCTDEIDVFAIGMSVGTIRRLIRRRSSALRFLPHVAALFSLQLPLAAVTEGFDALRGSHSRRSSACGSANHAIADGGSV